MQPRRCVPRRREECVRKAIRFIAIFVAAFAVGLVILGLIYEQIGRSHDARRLPPRIGRAVDIGGRTMNIFCSGEGSPAVVFESGGHGLGYEWVQVQPEVAKFTRACWYDRAGTGWSASTCATARSRICGMSPCPAAGSARRFGAARYACCVPAIPRDRC